MIHKPHSVDQIMRQLVFLYVLFGRIYILGNKSKMFTTYHHNDYKSFIFHLRKFHVYYNQVPESYYLTKIIDTNKLSIDYCNCSFCFYYFRENFHKLNRNFYFNQVFLRSLNAYIYGQITHIIDPTYWVPYLTINHPTTTLSQFQNQDTQMSFHNFIFMLIFSCFII